MGKAGRICGGCAYGFYHTGYDRGMSADQKRVRGHFKGGKGRPDEREDMPRPVYNNAYAQQASDKHIQEMRCQQQSCADTQSDIAQRYQWFIKLSHLSQM